jgi:hypothetical protein
LQTVKAGFGVCEACTKRAPEDTFTYSELGQNLCRGCHAELVHKVATKAQRSHEEHRRYPACHKVMVPSVEVSKPRVDWERRRPRLSTVDSRRYQCACGRKVTILSWYVLGWLAFFGGGAAFVAGPSSASWR